MRYFLVWTILFGTAKFTYAQDWVEGQLIDPASEMPVQFAHVKNLGNSKGTITNVDGGFRIPASAGDTIVFSSIGYERLGWVVGEDWFSSIKIVELPQDTTMLNEVVVNQIPPEAIFKQRLLNYQPEDTSFWYHGMPKPQPYDNSPLSEKTINNPLFAIAHPTEFLYQKFGRSAKEKRKYHQITQHQFQQKRAYQKFNREWISEVTSLKGDELTGFIAFCDFTIEYIEKTPLYIIQEELLAKLSAFKKDQKS